ncbi:efflux transporter outer membrane subunit [Dyella sp. Tek66A03]|uniref:efflux transporter outer membrane subunit n=1 Tax=Dyella sp. Tek66A03 TaxID=3458298 RepID=UPI00403EEE71
MRRGMTCGLSGLAVVLAGCANTGGIHPTAALVDPANLQSGASIASLGHDADWPQADWWGALNDPQLDQLIQLAVEIRPDLQAARARLDLAQYQARIAGATLQPQLETHLDLSRERFARYTTPSPPGGYTVWSNEVGVDLSYDLDLWGRNRAELAGAIDAVKENAAELQAVKIALEVAVVRAYVQLWAQYRLLDAFDSLHDEAVSSRDIVAARLHAGLSSPLELTQAETVVATSANHVEQARHDIALLKNELGALSGRGPGAGDGLTRPALTFNPSAILPSALPADLLGRRPDIVAQRWRVETASQGIKVAHAAFYPNIDLVALASLGSVTRFGGFFNFLDKNGGGHKVGAALSLPLFDGGRLQGQYGVAVATYDGAVDAYNQSVLDALREVADEVTALKSLDAQSHQARLATSSADRAYALATQGYRGGITEFLDVLVTQDTQVRQQQVLIITEAQELDAWVLLMRALGGGYLPSTSTHDAPAA